MCVSTFTNNIIVTKYSTIIDANSLIVTDYSFESIFIDYY